MSDNNTIWLKIKRIIVKIAVVLALLSLIYGAGHLVINDIPTTIQGYQEIPIEYTEDDDWMGIPHNKATKTVKKKVSFSDASVMILNDLIVIILSGAVLIFVFDPTCQQSELLE